MSEKHEPHKDLARVKEEAAELAAQFAVEWIDEQITQDDLIAEDEQDARDADMEAKRQAGEQHE